MELAKNRNKKFKSLPFPSFTQIHHFDGQKGVKASIFGQGHITQK